MKNPRAPTSQRALQWTCAFLTVAVMLLLDWNFATRVHALDGFLDPAFGDGGKVMTTFPSYEKGYTSATASALAFQADGKILAAGKVGKWVGYGAYACDFALARYNSDGSLDRTFGSGGLLYTNFDDDFPPGGIGTNEAHAVAILPDNRIVVGGVTQRSMALGFSLVCYNPDGSLDTSFGINGKTGHGEVVNGLAIQADGRIIAAGYNLIRYNPDGSLDQTFGSGGKVVPEQGSQFYSVVIQPDGWIIAAGSYSGNYLGVWRFTPDGTPDLTFGSNGSAAIEFNLLTGKRSRSANATSVALTADGQIVTVGSANFGLKGSRTVFARFNRDGSLDPSFGSEGKVVINSKNLDHAAMVVQPDGRLVVSMATYVNLGDRDVSKDFMLFRYKFDGSPDSSFGFAGMMGTDFGSEDYAFDLKVAPNGRLVAAGMTGFWEGRFALACYQNDINMETLPEITGAEVNGKKLYIYGNNFDTGAKVCLNGFWQYTDNDVGTPTTMLISRKAGKKIAPGETVQLRVMSAHGRASQEYQFTRPTQ